MEVDSEAAIAAANQVLVAIKATPKLWEAVNGEPRYTHTWTPTP